MWGLGFDSSGELILSAGLDAVCMWDRKGTRVARLQLDHEGAVRRMVHVPGTKRVALAVEAGPLIAWDTETGMRAWTLALQVTGSIGASPDGAFLAVGDSCWLVLVDARTGVEIDRALIEDSLGDPGHGVFIEPIHFLSSSQLLVGTSRGSVLQLALQER